MKNQQLLRQSLQLKSVESKPRTVKKDIKSNGEKTPNSPKSILFFHPLSDDLNTKWPMDKYVEEEESLEDINKLINGSEHSDELGMSEAESMMGMVSNKGPAPAPCSVFNPQGDVGVDRPKNGDYYSHINLLNTKEPGMNAEDFYPNMNTSQYHLSEYVEQIDQANTEDESNIAPSLYKTEKNNPFLQSPFFTQTSESFEADKRKMKS